jgi:hypothetical protein
MLTVVCLNSRDYQGCGDLYVSRLRSMVDRHLSLPHEFVVMTERDVSLAGWWGKLEVVERRFDDWVLYLDLDLVITSSLDGMVQDVIDGGAQSRTRLWMRDDFSYSIVDPRTDLDDKTKVLLGGPGTCNSSVMMWYRQWRLGPIFEEMQRMHGDQNVLTSKLWHREMIGLLPNDSIKSYKYHPGQIAPIVVFHGEPKPHQIPNDPIVREHWR